MPWLFSVRQPDVTKGLDISGRYLADEVERIGWRAR